MTTSRAGGLSLVGGNLALDFANTAAGRNTDAPVEHLRLATDLVDWVVHAGGLEAVTARRLRATTRDADATDALLRRAVRLRETIHGIGSALANGRPAPREELDRLKDVARQALASAVLAPGAGGYRFDFAAAPAETALLGPIAWSALDLLAKGGFDRLKQCPGEGCGWLFLDHSKNKSRRWCDMATCGNRTKGQRHRARR